MRAVHTFAACSLAAIAAALFVALFHPERILGESAPVAAVAVNAAATTRLPRLLGADGTPQPAVPLAVPSDPSERTRAALYATRAQAEALEAEHDSAVIWVETGCCGDSAVGVALEHVERLRTGRHLALDAPVFITGKNLKLAALVVDRLSDDGYEQVFLVTR